MMGSLGRDFGGGDEEEIEVKTAVIQGVGSNKGMYVSSKDDDMLQEGKFGAWALVFGLAVNSSREFAQHGVSLPSICLQCFSLLTQRMHALTIEFSALVAQCSVDLRWVDCIRPIPVLHERQMRA